MATSPMTYRRRRAAASALLLGAALLLTGCGDEGQRPGSAAGPPADVPAPPAPSTKATAPTSGPDSPGASPYVEPGAGDGAPHYRENNAYRHPGEMSPAGEREARTEAARMEPVLKRLWRRKTWDPESVRAELTGKLGYEERKTTGRGELLGGELDVREMDSRYENGEYVRPEGALIGLYVGDDACVTAFVQKTNYEVTTNGRFMETGCFEPPAGH
ncbi:hypothetical protein ACFVYR_18725 [Streptomyces sp. NPDC058284]|uniref:hypothetical protein n=1 Tax=unclassified Streptomyces TaxID=2593676 RepID=UPI00366221A0